MTTATTKAKPTKLEKREAKKAEKLDDLNSIKLPQRGILDVTMVGTRILVLNRYSERAADDWRAHITGEKKRKGKSKEDRKPQEEFLQSALRVPTPQGERVIWPARAWLRALNEAAIALNLEKDVASKAGINRCLEIEGLYEEDPTFCVIEPRDGDPKNGPAMREDMVRQAGRVGAPDLRWRSEFLPGWAVKLRVLIADLAIYPPQLVLVLLKTAGFLGIGDGCIKSGKQPMGWGKSEIAQDPKPALTRMDVESMAYVEA